ncbi:MAG: prepilin-type N-terminal cleavage/methylation domain-containing protein [bacterium]|nr:prepilin-type N-terminal cleavage/methylation domain-containing protein [bacterium]
MKRIPGFTMIEAVIVIAVLAILGAIMVPIISNNISSARLARAGSDTATIGKAIVQFRKDTALWPIEEGGNRRRLLFSDTDATNDGNPDNSAIPAGWNGIAAGERLSLEYNLIINAENYTRGPSAEGTPVWNGPYLSETRVDPWGNPYVVNSEWFYNLVGNNGVYVLSAGEGRPASIETPWGGVPPAGTDDITYRVQ